MKLNLMLIVLLVTAVNTVTAKADVLLIEQVERAKSMQLPANGLSKQQVTQRWGEPMQQYAAVGEPPITRWRYADYSVYFEYDRVISAVLHDAESNG